MPAATPAPAARPAEPTAADVLRALERCALKLDRLHTLLRRRP
ncbi:MAG: hypothetical protein VKJ05_03195 [Synechococcaceae cyanobacterium]|nr:hypothetical protein [Synechococcaceae cyanobacterium]